MAVPAMSNLRWTHFTAAVAGHTSEGYTGLTSGNHAPSLATIMAASPNSSFKVSTQVLINRHPANVLLDSGITDKSFISDDFAKALRLNRYSASGYVCMATSSLKSRILGYCVVEMKLQDRIYEDVRFSILDDLCT